ncbi:MAG: GNAT family N-acetyltransferase [Phycisphaerales bacterium]|nr:GNAT family N-acetyltransferase [Phycisphaerales bacterium]
MRVEETTYFYEMTDRSLLRPGRKPPDGAKLWRAEEPCPHLNRYLYVAVGHGWWWVDRLGWTPERWLEVIGREGYQTWVASMRGTPCGYFELDHREAEGGGRETSIEQFGLLPAFVGRGLGGWLLTECLKRAWEGEPDRVVLHTSSLDHPAARANYEARGFTLVRTETQEKDLPDPPPGPWGCLQRG